MKILNSFYMKIGVKSLIVLSIVFAYAMLSFYWGNHDWVYLKNKISLTEGFFEARYSMHLFNVLFLEGHILPVLMFLFLEIGFVALGIFSGIYLGIEKDTKKFLLFLLLIGVFPYNLIVSYYLFIAVPLIWWAVFGVLLLFLAEKQFTIRRFVLGGLGFGVLLGSYPPNIAFVFVLFMVRQIVEYVFKNSEIKIIVKKCVYVGGQFLIGCILFKLLNFMVSDIKNTLYNTRIYSVYDIFNNIPKELFNSFANLFLFKSELGVGCTVFLITLVITFFIWVLFYAKSKLFALVLIILMFIASRFMFILSPSSYVAHFRGGYWGILGIVISILGFLNLEKSRWFRNLLYVFEVIFLVIFVQIDFEAQKTMKLLFESEIKFNERVKSRIEKHEKYDVNNTYLSLSFGEKKYVNHFCVSGCEGYKNEILSSVAMNMDLIPLLFFDDNNYKIHTKLGVWDNNVWTVDDRKFLRKKTSIVSRKNSDIEDVYSWLYLEGKPWPDENSLYIDDNLMLLMLDNKNIYLYGSLFLLYLKNE